MASSSNLEFKIYIKDSKSKQIILELYPSFEKICNDIANYLKLETKYLFALIFVTESKIKKINSIYKSPNPTDVLVFPFKLEYKEILTKEEVVELGDVFICTSYIEKNLSDNSLFDEIKNVFIHGVLHLFGYDHTDEITSDEMFFVQDYIFDLQKSIN
ncbi:rRNA maturation RNase YbeY [symbiont of Argiope bruennichi]|uniref:rRNA maturation RNase YbeY n=1 Tax=symbiont of Argiope bruennichi TaxID=2810479 RepID=UPI003DA3015F